mgnify:CR=1 FL=1
MCINPNHVWVLRGPKWEQQPVACRQCWRCRKNRVDDYVARAMAEASVSEAVCTLSVTYAPRDDLADKVLHPRHFQLFMKLLRRRGHKVRYLVAGEYGDLKGRAHFHAVLFFKHVAAGEGEPRYNPDHLFEPVSSKPFCREMPKKRMVHIREWPHGHVSADWSASEAAIRYVCKYLLADDKNNAWFSLSKKPALGAEWFALKAERSRELSVLPHSFEYLPPGGDRNRPYLMTGATRRDYLAAITQDAAERPRMSEWVGKTFDKHDLNRRVEKAEAYVRACPLGALWRTKKLLDEYRISEVEARIRLLREETAVKAHNDDVWLPALAKYWGFEDVEEFKGFAAECERQGKPLFRPNHGARAEPRARAEQGRA